MSFASEVKKEVNSFNNLKNKELVKFELIGYFLSSNITEVKKKFKYATENEYNINRFSRLLSNLNIDHKIEIKGKIYCVEMARQEIQNKVMLEESMESIKEIKISEMEKRAIIRGVFMGSGTVTDPEKSYHLEMSVDGEEKRDGINNILKSIDISVKEHWNDTRCTIYIKGSEEISKFLAVIGVNRAVMYFEDIRVQKEMSGKVNRLVNCQASNISKTINAAVVQIAAIEKIMGNNKIELLDDNLREIAKLRVEFPDITLVELGQKLKEPIGKSGANYRLKKIVEIANEL